jgi:hypothetical protein
VEVGDYAGDHLGEELGVDRAKAGVEEVAEAFYYDAEEVAARVVGGELVEEGGGPGAAVETAGQQLFGGGV